MRRRNTTAVSNCGICASKTIVLLVSINGVVLRTLQSAVSSKQSATTVSSQQQAVSSKSPRHIFSLASLC
jgi:hypothetical protein